MNKLSVSLLFPRGEDRVQAVLDRVNERVDILPTTQLKKGVQSKNRFIAQQQEPKADEGLVGDPSVLTIHVVRELRS